MIPKPILDRNPLFKNEWLDTYYRVTEHKDAPIWNTLCGDRLSIEDKLFIDKYKQTLSDRVPLDNYPSDKILNFILDYKNRSNLFYKHLKNICVYTDFFQIPTTNRDTLSTSLADLVPIDEDLSKIVVYDTSGTTGHSIKIPNHPKAIGCYDPILEYVLKKHVQLPKIDHHTIACLLVCFQENTITYTANHSYWNGAGFAKINLHPKEWKSINSRADFINDLKPLFFTGDPISFLELLNINLSFSPIAFVSSAIKVNDVLRNTIFEKFSSPVIEIYSLNDTGPIAYTCPDNPDVYHQISDDIFIEITDDNGNNLGEDRIGEITITGGRNPFVPLLRYKTGDFAKISYKPCKCGEVLPSLLDFQGRQFVLFYGKDRKVINPIDISKIIRKYPIVQHRFIQNKDLNCILEIRPFDPKLPFGKSDLYDELKSLFGDNISISIQVNPNLSSDGKKVIPYLIAE